MDVLSTPIEVDQTARMPGGVLSVARPLPEDWQRGVTIPFYGCGAPIVRDKCVVANDVPHRPGVVEFPPFPIEQGAACSTLSRLPHADHALARLAATSEWAVGRQLSEDVVGLGSPSLADAVSLGTVTGSDPVDNFVQAVSCLEEAAAQAGYGARFVLHAPVRAAAYLAKSDGVSGGFSPSGASWIISPGYAPENDTTVRLWATGQVWAGVDAPDVIATTGYQTNDEEAFAMRLGLVAFDPCLNLSIDVTVPACPEPPGPAS